MNQNDFNKLIFPSDHGIYIFKDAKDVILYIGKAKNLKKRLQQYFTPSSIWKQDMVNKACFIDYHIVQNETEALQLEDNLIKKHQPHYNSILKWNNHYVYIKITKENFPQILITRHRKNDWATYVGPKYHSKNLREFLQYFRQILKYRGCKTTQFRKQKLCSDYYFWLCKGRCIMDLKTKKEYKKLMTQIKNFFEWKTNPIQKEIKSHINQAIKLQNFEWATKLRDMYMKIDDLTEHQRVILDPKLSGHFVKIEEIGNRYVYGILHFYEGKLIDVITNKQSIDDVDLQSLTISLQSEFENFSDISNQYSSLPAKKYKKEINEFLDQFLNNYIAKSSFEIENVMNDLLKQIQTRYQLKNFPYHIECIDISHMNWEQNSWWLSCLIGWVPHTKNYRHYKIANSIDDYSALKEVIIRRSKSNLTFPDLMIIDGGIWQLNILKELSRSKNTKLIDFLAKTDFVSLGKWEARSRKWKQSGQKEIIYKFHKFPFPNVGKGLGDGLSQTPLIYDHTDSILIKARNEAHRFANSYRKTQASKPRKIQ